MPLPFADPRIASMTRLLDVSMMRQRVHLDNMANQNTPGYKSKAVEFEQAFNAALDEGEDGADVEPAVIEPRTTAAQPDGNDVAAEREVATLAKNQLLYNAYLAMTKGKMRLYTTAITSAPGG